MSTVVIQSFRENDVPGWISQCMNSVKLWAEGNDYAYLWMNDDFFDFASVVERDHCESNIYALTDICRLRWIEKLFLEGVSRVIWVDADVLVFSPNLVSLNHMEGSGFASELFMKPRKYIRGNFIMSHGHNNAFMFFDKGSAVFKQYHDLAETLLLSHLGGEIPRTVIGPSLLNQMHTIEPLNSIGGVGLFTPNFMRDISVGGSELTETYLTEHSTRLGAANLCHFVRNQLVGSKRRNYDKVYGLAVQKLISLGELGLSYNQPV